jgi:hypothetical protein
MGYSYDARTRRLCCDSCGAADGTTRRRNCPAGYCPAYAMCASCWTDPEKRAAFKSYHVEQDCAGSMARAAAEWAEVAAAKATGAYVFCASVYADSTRETVRCWFRNSSDRTKELVVPLAVRETLTRTSTYDAALAAVSS